jgi:formylglycine-generating enzyme required for sulfatase activity
MAFGKWCVVFACCLIFPGMVQAQDIELTLQMPGRMFGPGSLFSVDLAVENTGDAYSDAQLFVALTVGTSDFWFYPSWVQFPPNIDWENIFVPAYSSDQWVILPAFSWPHGAGSFESAMFLAAIIHDGELVSNLAETYFGWTDAPPAFEVYIPPGTYTRGSPEDEPCRNSDETQHQVTLTRGFYMMETEVTRQMWVDLKAAQPTLPSDPSDTSISLTMNHPVQDNTWYEAILFANLLSVQNGLTPSYYLDHTFETVIDDTNYLTDDVYCNFDARGYRLPTEAEWEYACRAGTTGPFWADEPNYSSANCDTHNPDPPLNILDSIAWWAGNSNTGSYWMAHPVSTKLANPWGLYDIHGNVCETCWDWYGDYPEGPVTNPTGPLNGSDRISRGGTWNSTAKHARSARRIYTGPGNSYNTIGFRLVRTVP